MELLKGGSGVQEKGVGWWTAGVCQWMAIGRRAEGSNWGKLGYVRLGSTTCVRWW